MVAQIRINKFLTFKWTCYLRIGYWKVILSSFALFSINLSAKLHGDERFAGDIIFKNCRKISSNRIWIFAKHFVIEIYFLKKT